MIFTRNNTIKIKEFLLLLLTLLFLSACSSNSDVEVIINADQFSKVNKDKLIEIMGEPEEIMDYEWRIPKNQESIVGELYLYDNNRIEFVIFDNTVVRLNVQSDKFLNQGEDSIQFTDKKDIFKMFNIEPSDNIKKVVDNNFTLKYENISERIDEIAVEGIKDGTEFGRIKFTYDSNYY